MSQIWKIEDSERLEIISRSPIWNKYDTLLDRESAFELLQEHYENRLKNSENNSINNKTNNLNSSNSKNNINNSEKINTENNNNNDIFWNIVKTITQKNWKNWTRQSYLETFTKKVLRSVGTKVANNIVRGIFGSMK